MALKKGHYRGPALDPARRPTHDAATAGYLDRGLLRLWLPSSHQAKAAREVTQPAGQVGVATPESAGATREWSSTASFAVTLRATKSTPLRFPGLRSIGTKDQITKTMPFGIV